MLELGQLLPFVMEAVVVFHHRLVTIAAKALVAVGAAQLLSNLAAGALRQLAVIDGPGGIADHRKTGRIHLLAGRFARQQALQGAPQPHDGVVGNHQAAAAVAVGAVEIEPLQGLQRRLDQADGTGIALRQAVVALVAPLPDAVVGHAVGAGHVVHQILDEVALVAAAHHNQAGAGQLGELQQEQGRGV